MWLIWQYFLVVYLLVAVVSTETTRDLPHCYPVVSNAQTLRAPKSEHGIRMRGTCLQCCYDDGEEKTISAFARLVNAVSNPGRTRKYMSIFNDANIHSGQPCKRKLCRSSLGPAATINAYFSRWLPSSDFTHQMVKLYSKTDLGRISKRFSRLTRVAEWKPSLFVNDMLLKTTPDSSSKLSSHQGSPNLTETAMPHDFAKSDQTSWTQLFTTFSRTVEGWCFHLDNPFRLESEGLQRWALLFGGISSLVMNVITIFYWLGTRFNGRPRQRSTVKSTMRDLPDAAISAQMPSGPARVARIAEESQNQPDFGKDFAILGNDQSHGVISLQAPKAENGLGTIDDTISEPEDKHRPSERVHVDSIETGQLSPGDDIHDTKGSDDIDGFLVHKQDLPTGTTPDDLRLSAPNPNSSTGDQVSKLDGLRKDISKSWNRYPPAQIALCQNDRGAVNHDGPNDHTVGVEDNYEQGGSEACVSETFGAVNIGDTMSSNSPADGHEYSNMAVQHECDTENTLSNHPSFDTSALSDIGTSGPFRDSSALEIPSPQASNSSRAIMSLELESRPLTSQIAMNSGSTPNENGNEPSMTIKNLSESWSDHSSIARSDSGYLAAPVDSIHEFLDTLSKHHSGEVNKPRRPGEVMTSDSDQSPLASKSELSTHASRPSSKHISGRSFSTRHSLLSCSAPSLVSRKSSASVKLSGLDYKTTSGL